MKHIFEMLSSAFNVHADLESLEKDVELLEAFIEQANGCGLESLDNAIGKMIESGLSARYPEHFQLGSGLEGLKELTDKLKQGIAGLKKLARGKAKPFVEKMARETTAEIDKTYANKAWFAGKSAIGKPVSVAALAALVGDVQNYADVERQVKALLKIINTHMDSVTSDISAYWNKAEPFYMRAVKAKGEESAKVLSDLLATLPKRANQSFNEELPKLGGGKGDTIDGLTVEQAEAMGALLKSTMLTCIHLANNTSDVIENCGIADAGDYDDIEDKELAREIHIRTYWEDYYMPVDRIAKKAADYGVQVIKQLEHLIVNSVK